MKWLTLDFLRTQLRLDADQTDDDAYIEALAEVAEDSILSICNRSWDNVQETYGNTPRAFTTAAAMLVAQWYRHREPSDSMQTYTVPYAYDLMLKPYIKLAGYKDCPD